MMGWNILEAILLIDIGVLLGMALTMWFVGKHGCYQGCMMSDKKD